MQGGNGGNDARRRNRFQGFPLEDKKIGQSPSRKKIKTIEENKKLCDDVLGIICKKLDFDDLFEFAGVCRSWRLCHKKFWKDFMELKSPFILEKSSYAKKSLSFFSLPDRKLNSLKMDKFWGLSYCGSSSGYLIFAGPNSLLLMNPFTRTKKEVSTSSLTINSKYKTYRVLFASVKGSTEFVIVVYSDISFNSMYVYQSRNQRWVDYSNNWEILRKVVDVVVLNNSIYVLTSKARIGVLNLNSASVKFLTLRNRPKGNRERFYGHLFRLVRDDDKTLLVHFMPGQILNVYEIDFLKMEYVKLDTLGEAALFGSARASWYVLRNASMWGYYNNHVYSICSSGEKCSVHSWNGNRITTYTPDYGRQVPNRSKLYWMGWYFRNLQNEVEYSLV